MKRRSVNGLDISGLMCDPGPAVQVLSLRNEKLFQFYTRRQVRSRNQKTTGIHERNVGELPLRKALNSRV
jgi:hypothetical protein